MIDLSKYKDKTILILGGGTSTLDTKWENLKYDYVWTCNEFYLEPRVLNQDIDLYVLSHTVDLKSNVLIDKLRDSNTSIILEPTHFRDKVYQTEYKVFKSKVNKEVFKKDIAHIHSPGGKSGVTFRLILLSLFTEASQILFSGFDGFNKDFTNKHAFTKHPGLKDTDKRRTYEGTEDSYVTIFTDAFNILTTRPGFERLQNLGEGFDYNIGTPISKEYFPLKKEIYEKIR